MTINETKDNVSVAEQTSATEGYNPHVNPDQPFGPVPVKKIGSLSLKLKADPIPGFKQYWFNENKHDFQELSSEGWSHVNDKQGKPTKALVGTDEDRKGVYAYLMKVPQYFWDAWKADEQSLIDETDKAIGNGTLHRNTSIPGSYVPMNQDGTKRTTIYTDVKPR